MITSSIKLNLQMVVDIKPWLIMNLLGEEFVSLNSSEIKEIDYVFVKTEPVGTIIFNKELARLYREDERFYLLFENGMCYGVSVNDEQ